MLGVGVARAELPDVIGVLTDEIGEEGEWTLGVHFNSTPSGAHEQRTGLAEIRSDHGVRLSPTLYYGLRDFLEVSLSTPIVRDGDSKNASIAGMRGRVTWIPTKREERSGGLYWGATGSLLLTQQKYEPGKTVWDVGLIAGYRTRSWHLASNVFASGGLANGQQKESPDYSAAIKLVGRVQGKTWLGGELHTSRFKPFADDGDARITTNTLFGTVEWEGRKNAFQFGVGRGLNNASDRWTLKFAWFTSL